MMKRLYPSLASCALFCVATVTHAEDKKPGHYFGPEAYPADAARLHQQGRVVLHLIISPAGSVTACTVTASSGSPSLDADACDKALHKVRFTPARDDAGRPVQSTYELPMRYVLPDDLPPTETTAAPAPGP
ncbi:MAG: energy transducer TonB [Sphingomonas sp.]|jgi:TonB family protein|uniref:energy transducer TonB n=1 Tax=Sphingomonas sp. TaxID=28214 RepID=UPI00356705DB